VINSSSSSHLNCDRMKSNAFQICISALARLNRFLRALAFFVLVSAAFFSSCSFLTDFANAGLAPNSWPAQTSSFGTSFFLTKSPAGLNKDFLSRIAASGRKSA
jgi:hypothetical protein